MARKKPPIQKELSRQVQELTARLREAEETLHAIYNGEVDGLVVAGPGGDQVYTLKGAESPYRLMVEAMQEGAVTVAEDRTILYCNRRFAEMIRVDLESVIGSSFLDRVPLEQRNRMEGLLEEGWSGRHGRQEIDMQVGDGSLLPVLVTPSVTPSGDVQSLSLIIRDLTEQHARTQEMTRHQDQLRALAALLSQTEQRERRRLAQVLHDNLQQLLVAAKIRVSGLRAGADATATAVTEQVQSLLSEAIQVSRSLTSELSPPVLYTQGLASALQWLKRWMKDKHGLEVDIGIDKADDTLSDDRRAFLFDCIRELLFNVVKHAGTDHAQIHVIFDQKRGETRVLVEDRGVGLIPTMRGNEEFRGFGLFSIRERLQLMGGVMQIEGSPGHGTRVLLITPGDENPAAAAVGREVVHDNGGAAGENADAAAAATPSHRIRVVIVDDHQLLREGLAQLLRNQPDLELVGEAADGKSAIELVRACRPDVIVMDVTMPRLGGIEATRVIRREFRGTHIVALSMHEEAEVADAMSEAGAAFFLRKDGPSDQLIRAIRAVAANTEPAAPVPVVVAHQPHRAHGSRSKAL